MKIKIKLKIKSKVPAFQQRKEQQINPTPWNEDRIWREFNMDMPAASEYSLEMVKASF
jgi:hypothetical protein